MSSENNGWFQLEGKPPLKNTPPKRTISHTTTPVSSQASKPVTEHAANSSTTAAASASQNENNQITNTLSSISGHIEGKSAAVPPRASKPGPLQVESFQSRSLPQWSGDLPAKRHSQTVGRRGPVLEQDNILHETLETFVHEKIIERPVHVKGFGAFGYFETVHSMSEYTKLSFLQRPGQQVPVTVRFSLAVSTKGTPDTSRNVRGFATKFYTDEGIFDLICNHIPVFSVRDAIRFPESIKAFLPSPTNNLIDPDRFWSFVARAPESMHFVVRLYSDAGTVKSLRHIPGH
ncbi:catalase, partial [Peribacillus sp. NPDC056705]|uniref:catalase n=1 Tax=Peribacillus sp. NPDC056705 TaxID=3345918 RepID=UPI00374786E6